MTQIALQEAASGATGSCAVAARPPRIDAQPLGLRMLTSANHDGANGLAAIGQASGTVFVQNPKTAEAALGARAALAEVRPDAVLSVDQIAQQLIDRCSSQQRKLLTCRRPQRTQD